MLVGYVEVCKNHKFVINFSGLKSTCILLINKCFFTEFINLVFKIRY